MKMLFLIKTKIFKPCKSFQKSFKNFRFHTFIKKSTNPPNEPHYTPRKSKKRSDFISPDWINKNYLK